MSDMPSDAAAALADYMLANRPDIPTVDGPVQASTTAAELVAAHAGRTPRAGLDQRMLTTDTITQPSAIPGHMRAATVNDLDLVSSWIGAFSAEAIPGQPTSPTQRETLRRRLETAPATIWLWDVGDRPTSLCWQSLPAAGVVRISAVYTPPAERGRGYASANVAALSQQALDQGVELVMLYTDRTNPTSNKIYEAIGFRHVGDAMEWLLR
jgi:predicted GNAT family acetyltransferase